MTTLEDVLHHKAVMDGAWKACNRLNNEANRETARYARVVLLRAAEKDPSVGGFKYHTYYVNDDVPGWWETFVSVDKDHSSDLNYDKLEQELNEELLFDVGEEAWLLLSRGEVSSRAGVFCGSLTVEYLKNVVI